METILALGAWNWLILAALVFVLELTAPASSLCGSVLPLRSRA